MAGVTTPGAEFGATKPGTAGLGTDVGYQIPHKKAPKNGLEMDPNGDLAKI